METTSIKVLPLTGFKYRAILGLVLVTRYYESANSRILTDNIGIILTRISNPLNSTEWNHCKTRKVAFFTNGEAEQLNRTGQHYPLKITQDIVDVCAAYSATVNLDGECTNNDKEPQIYRSPPGQNTFSDSELSVYTDPSGFFRSLES